MVRVTLYVREECHLCREAEATLSRLASQLGLTWERVDIEGDPELERRYGEKVPVLAINGKPMLSAPLSEKQIRQLFRAKRH